MRIHNWVEWGWISKNLFFAQILSQANIVLCNYVDLVIKQLLTLSIKVHGSQLVCNSPVIVIEEDVFLNNNEILNSCLSIYKCSDLVSSLQEPVHWTPFWWDPERRAGDHSPPEVWPSPVLRKATGGSHVGSTGLSKNFRNMFWLAEIRSSLLTVTEWKVLCDSEDVSVLSKDIQNFEPSPLCSNKDDCSKFKIWVCCIGKDLS